MSLVETRVVPQQPHQAVKDAIDRAYLESIILLCKLRRRLLRKEKTTFNVFYDFYEVFNVLFFLTRNFEKMRETTIGKESLVGVVGEHLDSLMNDLKSEPSRETMLKTMEFYDAYVNALSVHGFISGLGKR